MCSPAHTGVQVSIYIVLTYIGVLENFPLNVLTQSTVVSSLVSYDVSFPISLHLVLFTNQNANVERYLILHYYVLFVFIIQWTVELNAIYKRKTYFYSVRRK